MFAQYFPNPEQLKKKKSKEGAAEENPFRSVITWFDKGNALNIFFNTKDADKIVQLYQVDGLHALVKKYFPQASDAENALLMEFVLHGLASYSLISKRVLEAKIEFKDLMGSMINLGNTAGYRDEDDNEY
jgi:magnesium chelatase subunit I